MPAHTRGTAHCWLTEELARRWGGRCFSAKDARRCQGTFLPNRFWKLVGEDRVAEKIHFLKFDFAFVRRFGFFAGANNFAELTRMFAVEGFRQRLLDRTFLRKAEGHADPGDRLQNNPMSADAHDERADNKPF